MGIGRGGAPASVGSGGKALAALGTPRRYYAAAGCGRHPRAKAMTALAYEVAGLVSALHGTGSHRGSMPPR
jgi:hypothetical protein